MLHEDTERLANLQVIADIYAQLPPLARFRLWLMVFLLKKRPRKLYYHVNIFRRRPVKFLDQLGGGQVGKDTSSLV